MLVTVLADGQLRLYNARPDGEVEEWGRLRLAKDLPPEGLVRLSLDLAHLAVPGLNGSAAPAAPPLALPAGRAGKARKGATSRRRSSSDLSQPMRPVPGRALVGRKAQIVQALISAGGGPLSVRELAARTGAPERSLAASMSELRHAGVVVRPRMSQWMLAADGPPDGPRPRMGPGHPPSPYRARVVAYLREHGPSTREAVRAALGDREAALGLESLRRAKLAVSVEGRWVLRE